MKKISSILLVILLLMNLLPLFCESVISEGEHDKEDEIVIGEIETDSLPRIFSFPGTIWGVRFPSNDSYMTVSIQQNTGSDGNISIINTIDFSFITNLTVPNSEFQFLDISNDDTYLAVAGGDLSMAHIFWTSNWTFKQNLTDNSGFNVDFSPNGSWLAVFGMDQLIYIYDVPSFTLNTSWDTGDWPSYNTLWFSPDSQYLAYTEFSSHDTVIYWTANWTEKTRFDTVGGITLTYASKWSNNGTWLAVSDSTNIAIYGTSDFTEIVNWTIVEDSPQIDSIDFSPDDRFMFVSIYETTGDDMIVSVVNTSNWETVATWTDEDGGSGGWSQEISHNNQYLVSDYETALDKKLRIRAIFNVTRDVDITPTGEVTESETFQFTAQRPYTGNVTLKVPVSSSVTGIINVKNETTGTEATPVTNKASLVNNTYYFDSANNYVYIETIDLSVGSFINWTVNCSYGMTFSLTLPTYLKVGDYFIATGLIKNATGVPVDGVLAKTRILYANGIDALETPPEWNCTNGNYYCVFSTSSLLPGIYSISIEFNYSGVTYKEGSTLYLSVDPGPGVHVSTFLHFTFYNSNTRIGIPSESFKIYVSTDTVIDSTDRIYVDVFDVYTGKTIYYRVDDYFDNQIYPTSGEYESLEITSIDQFEDIPITWYDLSIKNLNQTIMHFSMENSSRYYNITLFPMDSVHINVLPGSYDITLKFYSTINGSLLETVTDAISISGDAFYIATGYNAMVHVSWYNTNEGLGTPDETLKLYFNDQRHTSQTYWTYINQTIKITVKDYYNFTLFEGNFTITSLYRFLDFGLTFHEYDFTNANDEYFYASFLKDGATRWYEKVVSSGGQKAFMLPSGNYTVRVYNADNSTYLSWTETINRSKAYLIGTDGVSLIIQGQSVIIGEFLELSEELAYAFMPDVTIISRNPIMTYSIYDTEGMSIGDSYKICPPLITIATTRVTQYGNWINTTPMVPGNNSVANGTVTIVRDVLYLSGPSSISWVNITYTSNGSLFGNTTHIPSRLDIYGENLTINASGKLSVLRVTKFNQVRKFDWTVYPFSGHGYDLNRAWWHEAGIEVINCLPVPLYEVYVIAGFPPETSVDGSSVEIRDTTNGGIILEKGPDYDVTDTSIHFSTLCLVAYEHRCFTLGFYKLSAESYIYDEGIVSIPTYDKVVWNGDSYNTFPAHWNNPYDRTFRGALYIKLDFSVPTDIDVETMRIWDLTNDRELDRSLFIPGRNFIRISAEAIGDVLPGSSRKFDVYFLMTEFAGADPKEFHLDSEIFMGITPFLIIFLIGVGFIILGAFLAAWDKKNKDRWKVCVAMGIFIIVVIYILNMMGL